MMIRKRARPHDSAAAKARATMRALMARGFTDEQTLVGAASDALGGDATAGMIALMVWRKEFAVTEAN